MDDGFNHLSRLKRASVDTNKQLALTKSRERLKELQQKRLKTTMIGALDKFERFFGDLWGHGKHPNELTSKEAEFRQKWEICRTLILDNGNAQVRALNNELESFKIILQTIKERD